MKITPDVLQQFLADADPEARTALDAILAEHARQSRAVLHGVVAGFLAGWGR